MTLLENISPPTETPWIAEVIFAAHVSITYQFCSNCHVLRSCSQSTSILFVYTSPKVTKYSTCNESPMIKYTCYFVSIWISKIGQGFGVGALVFCPSAHIWPPKLGVLQRLGMASGMEILQSFQEYDQNWNIEWKLQFGNKKYGYLWRPTRLHEASDEDNNP